MAVKDILDEIDTDVTDIINTSFEYSNTTNVPNRGDTSLSFERGETKRGKTLTTCVLYVDIRNSVELTIKHQNVTMGKIYTAFAKAVLKAAKYHSGHIRNIIGDRVMVVFPSTNCFTNAVDCAITINHIASKIINQKFPNVDFKCGIGIDYGDLRVIKVGITRRGTEGTENRSLIWAGYPANFASRLTDVANKKIEEKVYEVTRNPINPLALGGFGFLNILGNGNRTPNYNEPLYLDTRETINLTPEEFAETIHSHDDGTLFMSGGRVISFSKRVNTIEYPAILMTEAVYNGFRRANPTRKSIVENYWTLQRGQIKNVISQIYGGKVIWELTN